MSDSVKFKASTCHHLTFNGEEYIRFGSDCWYQFFANSLESVSDCTKLEELYIIHYFMD